MFSKSVLNKQQVNKQQLNKQLNKPRPNELAVPSGEVSYKEYNSGLWPALTWFSAAMAVGLIMGAFLFNVAEAAEGPGGKRYFQIEPKNISMALNEFAMQADSEILFTPDIVEGKQTSGLTGEFTDDEALQKILAGSGLEYKQVDEKVFLVVDPETFEGDAESYKGKSGNANKRVIEEIMVTAQKREQSAYDVPMTITAFSAESIEKQGIANLDDLKFAAPGIGVYEEGPGRQNVHMRGIGNLIGNQGLAGVYLDDASANTGGVTGAIAVASQMFPVQFTDIERIEVLYGPQGTLYGAGAVSGVIRYITRDPQLDRFGAKGDMSLSFTKEGDPSQKATAVINVPIIENEFAIRIASTIGRSGGWIDMPSKNSNDINNQDLEEVRVKALWQPTDKFNARATVLVHRNESDVGTNIADENGIWPPVPEDNRPRLDVRKVPYTEDAELYNLTLSYDTGLVNLLSASTYISRKSHSLGYVRGSELTAFPGLETLGETTIWNDVFTQELRVSSSEKKALSWTAGAFYRDRKGQQRDLSGDLVWNELEVVTILEGPDGVWDELTTTSWAAFGDASYTFFDRLEVGGGIRYFEDDQKYKIFTLGVDNSATFDATTWRAYASYDVTESIKAYTTVGTGFRSGGINSSATGLLPPYEPETLLSYEVGTKMSLLDGRMQAEIALFFSEYDDFLNRRTIFDGTTFVQIIGNAGTAEVKGVDASLTWQIADRFRLNFSGTYTDNEITELSDGAVGVAVGDPLNYVPEYTFSAGGEYDFNWQPDVPGFVRLDYYQRGENSITDRGAYLFNPQYSDKLGFLNARLGGEWKQWTFELFGDNLLDENGTTQAAEEFSVTPRPRPRTFGIKVGVDFE